LKHYFISIINILFTSVYPYKITLSIRKNHIINEDSFSR